MEGVSGIAPTELEHDIHDSVERNDNTPSKPKEKPNEATRPRRSMRTAEAIRLPNVSRIDALSRYMSPTTRVVLFSTMLLFAYSIHLANTVLGSYQPYALSSMGKNALQASVVLIGLVVGVASQFISSKTSDVFGRLECFCVGIVLNVIGLILRAVANDVATYSAGVVLSQLAEGFTQTLLIIIIADVTSTRSRVFFEYVLMIPAIIDTWVGGTVVGAVLDATTWKWGIGMWAIIIPVTAIPFVVSLYVTLRRASKQDSTLEKPKNEWPGLRKFAVELFWLLDLVGIVLIIAIFGLILVPLTLAGGEESHWRSGGIIAPLVCGVACIPLFVVWELKSKNPLIPYDLMKMKNVWAPLAMGIFYSFTWSTNMDYIYTVLLVSFNFTNTEATRISSVFNFVQAAIGPLVGVAIYKFRRLKAFIISGVLLYVLGCGLLIRYRGSPEGDGRVGLIAAIVLTGVGASLFVSPSSASLEAVLKHEDLAAMVGLREAVSYVGFALGSCVSGALWTQLLPGKLRDALAGVDPSLAVPAYESPLTAIVPKYPMGTPVRTAVVHAYLYIQRVLAITAVGLCVPLVLLALILPDLLLTNDQTLAHADDEYEGETEPEPAVESESTRSQPESKTTGFLPRYSGLLRRPVRKALDRIVEKRAGP